jgi:hypothetical protein
MGSIWQISVRESNGQFVTISGDARMIRASLESAYGSIANARGREIRFVPDPVFGASSWEPMDADSEMD